VFQQTKAKLVHSYIRPYIHPGAKTVKTRRVAIAGNSQDRRAIFNSFSLPFQNPTHFRKSKKAVVLVAGGQPTAEEVERVKKVSQELQGLVLAGTDRFFNDLKYISFFMLPIYALVFQMLYRREKRFYIDHLVYTLHLQSFGYAVVAVAMLIPFLSRHSIPIVQSGTVLLLLVYMAQSLRYLYGQSWPKTIVKSMVATLLLLFLMLVTMGLYASIPILPVLPRVIHELETGRSK